MAEPSMGVSGAREIGWRFLEDLDKFIKDNLHGLTCRDIDRMYFDFWEDLKKVRGSSSGFTGLSELIVFRFLCHLLGGDFEPQEISDKSWRLEFVSQHNDQIRIGQSNLIQVDGRKYYPDIVIWHAEQLIGVAQIKITLPRGLATVNQEMETLNKLKREYPEMRASLLLFAGLNEGGAAKAKLDQLEKSHSWFSYLALWETKKPFGQELRKQLDLGRIIPTSTG